MWCWLRASISRSKSLCTKDRAGREAFAGQGTGQPGRGYHGRYPEPAFDPKAARGARNLPRRAAHSEANAAGRDEISRHRRHCGCHRQRNQDPQRHRLNGARPSRGAWAKRAAFGFLFALASVAAAEAWDRYGDTAREMLAQWTPALSLPSSQPQPATATAASPQPAPSAAEAAVTDQTPASPAPAALQPAPATAAAMPAAGPDQTQQLQSMTQDLAAMGQQIEALKATIAQLKAGQEQMAQQLQRDAVKNAVARNARVKLPKPDLPKLGPPRQEHPSTPKSSARRHGRWRRRCESRRTTPTRPRRRPPR